MKYLTFRYGGNMCLRHFVHPSCTAQNKAWAVQVQYSGRPKPVHLAPLKPRATVKGFGCAFPVSIGVFGQLTIAELHHKGSFEKRMEWLFRGSLLLLLCLLLPPASGLRLMVTGYTPITRHHILIIMMRTAEVVSKFTFIVEVKNGQLQQL